MISIRSLFKYRSIMSKQVITVILSIAALVLATSFLGKLFGQTDNDELSKAIKGGAYLVDVRTPGEFAGGSVEGAVNIPLSDVARELKQFEGKETIVVFCKSGNRSGKAKQILEQNGFKNVINGGSWQNVNSVKSKKK